MLDGNSRLADTVSEIIGLLQICGLANRANWISERLAVLTDPSATEDALEHVRGELHRIVPGMGGLLDLGLTPGAGSTMTSESVEARMRDLAGVLFAATR